jgi:hypothetical protein
MAKLPNRSRVNTSQNAQDNAPRKSSAPLMVAAAFNPLRIASVPKHEEHDAAHEARGPMQARFNPYDFNGGCVPRGTERSSPASSVALCALCPAT